MMLKNYNTEFFNCVKTANVLMLGAIGLSIFAGAAIAAPETSPSAKSIFAQIDGNKDGFLTQDEVSKLDPALAQNFIVADVNVDGKLDIAEFETLLAGGKAASKPNKQ